MTKRWRTPVAKPGELKIAYGRVDRHEGPDIVYCWGPGTSRRDTLLLHHRLGSPQVELVHGDDAVKLGRNWNFGKSFLDELEERGYDLTTLKFSIQKKKEAP